MGSGGFVGDPLRFARRASDASVEALSGFGDDVGEAGGDPFAEGADEFAAFFEHDAASDLDAVAQEDFFGASLVQGVGVAGAEDDAGESGLDQGVGARGGAAVGAAGFEGDVDGGAPEEFGESGAGVFDGFDFGVGSAGEAMVSCTDEFAVFDDDGADGGVRSGEADALASLTDGHAHPVGINGVFIGGRVHFGSVSGGEVDGSIMRELRAARKCWEGGC